MNRILIFDNFLDNTDDISYICQYIDNSKFMFGHESTYTESQINQFFSTHDLNYFFLNYLKNKIEKLTSKKYKLDRNYMHIQTFGQDGGYHYDTLEKDCYSFCLYITNINNNKIDNSNGELFIKIPGEKHILSIDTYMNRGVFFPSNYLHKGMAYNRYIKDKRLCITWKLKEII